MSIEVNLELGQEITINRGQYLIVEAITMTYAAHEGHRHRQAMDCYLIKQVSTGQHLYAQLAQAQQQHEAWLLQSIEQQGRAEESQVNVDVQQYQQVMVEGDFFQLAEDASHEMVLQKVSQQQYRDMPEPMTGAQHQLVIDKTKVSLVRPLIWLGGQQFCTEHEPAQNLTPATFPATRPRSVILDVMNVMLLVIGFSVFAYLPMMTFFPEWMIQVESQLNLSFWLTTGLLSDYFAIAGWCSLVLMLMTSRLNPFRPLLDIVAVGYGLFVAFRWVDNWIVLEMADIALYQDIFRLSCLVFVAVLYYGLRKLYGYLSSAVLGLVMISWILYSLGYGVSTLFVEVFNDDILQLDFVWGFGEPYWGYLWTVLLVLMMIGSQDVKIPMTTRSFLQTLSSLIDQIKQLDPTAWHNDAVDMVTKIDALLEAIRLSNDRNILALQEYKVELERLKTVIEHRFSEEYSPLILVEEKQLAEDFRVLVKDLQLLQQQFQLNKVGDIKGLRISPQLLQYQQS